MQTTHETTLPKPSTEASRVKWVHFWLLERTGLAELRAVAARLGVTPATLANVVAGQRRTPELQRSIAKLIGLPPIELFGPHTHWSLLQPEKTAKRKVG